MKKRIISIALTFSILMSTLMCLSGITAGALTAQDRQNIVNRAEYMWNATWNCKKTITAWGSTFYAGNTYRIPYGQPINSGKYIGFGVSVPDYLAAAANVNSIFYSGQSYYTGKRAPYYANDCSAFVSWCWGCDRKTTYSIPQVSTYQGMATEGNNKYLQLGDCLNSNGVGHVVLVTGLAYSGGVVSQIEITEQTPPQLKRSYYNPATLAAKYGANYGIYRYNGTVPPSPDDDRSNVKPVVDNVGVTDITSTGFTFSFNAKGDDGKDITAARVYAWPNSKTWDSAEAKTYGYNDTGSNLNGTVKKNGTTYTVTFNVANHANLHELYNVGLHIKIGNKFYQISNYYKCAYVPNAVNLGDKFYSKLKSSVVNIAAGLNQNNAVVNPNADVLDQIWLFERQSDGSYKITNKKNGRCLDVADASSECYANVQTWLDNGNNAQRWFIEKAANGYTLRPKCSMGCALDIVNGSSEPGTNLQTYTYHGGSAQQFDISTDTLPKPNASKVTFSDITNNGFTASFSISGVENISADSVRVYVWPSSKSWDSAEAKTYGYNDSGSDFNGAIKKNGNTYTLNVNISNHDNLKEYYSIGPHCSLYNEWFKLGDTYSGVYVPKGEDLGKDFYANIINVGSHTYATQVDGDVAGYARDGKQDQIWHFTRLYTGAYKIENKADGKYLDVLNASKESGANVQTWAENGNKAQNWFIEKADGGYKLRPECAPDCALNLNGGSAEDGTNINIYTNGSSKNQIFDISTATLPKPEMKNLQIKNLTTSGFDLSFEAVGEEGSEIMSSQVFIWPSDTAWDAPESKVYGFNDDSTVVNFRDSVKKNGNTYTVHVDVKNHGYYSGDYSVGIHIKTNYKYFAMGDRRRYLNVPAGGNFGSFKTKAAVKADETLFLSGNIVLANGDTESNAYVWAWEDHDDQVHTFHRLDDGTYTIKSDRGGYLTYSGTPENGLRLKFRIADEADVKKWNIRADGDYFIISPAEAPNYVIHIEGETLKNNSYAVLYKATESNAERFKLDVAENVLKGDVNLDGEVDIKDATLLQKYLAGLVEINDIQKLAAEVMGDGDINISDVTGIQKMIVGLM